MGARWLEWKFSSLESAGSQLLEIAITLFKLEIFQGEIFKSRREILGFGTFEKKVLEMEVETLGFGLLESRNFENWSRHFRTW